MAIRPMKPSGQCESELAAAEVALPELLAPAGGLDQMLAAIAAGADAIYAGLDGFNARVSAHGFSDDEFARGCAVAHAHGVRVYVTLNVFVFDDELADAVVLGAHARVGCRCVDCGRCRAGLCTSCGDSGGRDSPVHSGGRS